MRYSLFRENNTFNFDMEKEGKCSTCTYRLLSKNEYKTLKRLAFNCLSRTYKACNVFGDFVNPFCTCLYIDVVPVWEPAAGVCG